MTRLLLLLLACVVTFCYRASATPPPPLLDRYTLRGGAHARATAQPKEYIDPTLPPVLPNETPTCSVVLLQNDFANTYGSPPAAANYTPPENSSCRKWTRAVLELSASCAGEQYDRIAAVWIDGAELLRTSTAEPTETGVFWKVRKDVTRYSSLLRPSSSSSSVASHKKKASVVSMMLENIVNDDYTGVYHVNLSLHFYTEKSSPHYIEMPNLGLLAQRRSVPRGLGFPTPVSDNSKKSFSLSYGSPADVIIPISSEKGDDGFWFRIQNEADIHTRSIQIPNKAYRAVLEIFISFHSDDEFWYSNPPNSYIEENKLPTKRGNGSYRRVFVTVDGLFVGSVFPFPVVFTGGINPLFWSPVVSIGAFDLPSYDLELTPFLGNLLDGKPHEFGFGVSYGIPFWLVDANLHLWLDHSSVQAKLVYYKAPEVVLSRKSKSENLEGKFKIEAEGEFHFTGWVRSSLGNLTTHIEHDLKLKSSVDFDNNGDRKEVYTKTKSKTEVEIKGSAGVVIGKMYRKSKFPIRIMTSKIMGGTDKYVLRTNLSHVLYDVNSAVLEGVRTVNTISDKQIAFGLMEVQDHSVLSGSANTEQRYSFHNTAGCYVRTVDAQDGVILKDLVTTYCAFST